MNQRINDRSRGTLEWKRRRPYASAIVLTALLACVATSHAQGPGVSREYPLKAAFLYNFGNYVEWPAAALGSEGDPFVLGVLGRNPFGPLLNEIAAAKKLQGRSIAIRQLTDAGAAKECHMLFIAASVAETDRQAAIDATRSLPVLVVAETPGGAENGAVVNFFLDQNKVRFEINAEAARDRQLKVSSKLMSLAKIVEPRRVADR